jgi:hypothetical protein
MRAEQSQGPSPEFGRYMLLRRWRYARVADAGPANAERNLSNRMDITMEQLFAIRPVR